MSGKSGAHAITINMSGKHAGTLVGTALAPRREKEEHDTHEDAVDDVMKGKTTAMVMMLMLMGKMTRHGDELRMMMLVEKKKMMM